MFFPVLILFRSKNTSFFFFTSLGVFSLLFFPSPWRFSRYVRLPVKASTNSSAHFDLIFVVFNTRTIVHASRKHNDVLDLVANEPRAVGSPSSTKRPQRRVFRWIFNDIIVRNAVRVMAHVIVFAHVIAPGRRWDVLHGNDGRYTGVGRRFIANNRSDRLTFAPPRQ